jgi:hypothetical protein
MAVRGVVAHHQALQPVVLVLLVKAIMAELEILVVHIKAVAVAVLELQGGLLMVMVELVLQTPYPVRLHTMLAVVAVELIQVQVLEVMVAEVMGQMFFLIYQPQALLTQAVVAVVVLLKEFIFPVH